MARPPAALPWRGLLGPHGVSLVTEGGARIRVTAAPRSRVRLRIELDGGSGTEPPEAHGRAALCAAALAVHCEPLGRGRLRVEPLVTRRRIGWLLVGRAEHPEPVLDCLMREHPSPNAWRRGRLHALRRAERRWEMAWAARLLAPARPGWLAPLGDPVALRSLPRAEVLAWLRRQRVRVRFRADGVSPRPARLARHLLQHLRDWTPGQLPPRLPPPRPSRTTVVSVGAAPRTRNRFVVLWPYDPSSRPPRTVLSALGVTVLGVRKMRDGQGATWMALAGATLEPERIGGLPALLATAFRLKGRSPPQHPRWVVPARAPRTRLSPPR